MVLDRVKMALGRSSPDEAVVLLRRWSPATGLWERVIRTFTAAALGCPGRLCDDIAALGLNLPFPI